MKKCRVLFIALLLTCLIVTAQAVENRASAASMALTFEDQVATCAASCIASKPTDHISATVSLFQENRCLALWTDSGIHYANPNGTYPVESGVTYRLVLTWWINGEPMSSRVVTRTCP